MTIRSFMLIGAALGVGYGLAFLAIPGLVGQLYGVTPNPETQLAYRYFGVALLGSGLYCWAVKDTRDETLLRTFLVGHAIADLAGLAVSFGGAASGTLNALGWLNVALYAGLLLGCVYFLRAGSTLSYRAT